MLRFVFVWFLGWVLVLLASAWVWGLAGACLRLGLCGTLFVGCLTKTFVMETCLCFQLHFGFVTVFVMCVRVVKYRFGLKLWARVVTPTLPPVCQLSLFVVTVIC